MFAEGMFAESIPLRVAGVERSRPAGRRAHTMRSSGVVKGRAKHQARLDEISLLGKHLARRANRKCELCEGKDELRPYDAAPGDPPTMDTIALFCTRCRACAGGRDDAPETLRFLERAIWSSYGSVSSTSLAILRRVDAGWARAAIQLQE